MPPAPSFPWQTRPLTVLGITTLVQIVTVMIAHSMVVIAPAMAGVLAVDPALIGFQVSLVYGGAMIAVIFGGRLVQRFGACRTQQYCLALSALGAFGAMVPNVAVVALASLLMGIGTGPTTPASSHALNRFTDPANRNLLFSLKQTGVPLGVVSAAFLMPSTTLAVGPQWAFATVATIALLSIAVLAPARATWDDDRTPGVRLVQDPLGGLPVVWRHPVLRGLSLAAFFYAFTQLCVTSFTVTMLVTEFGVGLVQAGLLLSLVQLSGVVSRVLFGIYADRLGSALKPLALIGCATAVMCAITALLGPGWPRTGLYLLLVCLGASAVGWTGMFIAEVARVAPKGQVGIATSGAIAFNFLGILCGPALFAVAYGFVGSYAQTFGLLTLVALIGVAILLKTRRVESSTLQC
ncbi:MAG: MFS transporter [Proteobacteria bacterium]|nr:MFS transporter [Burkholderiales bacterium]